MYSPTSLSTLSLLASWVADINAYPTRPYLAPGSSDILSISIPNQNQQQPPHPRTLYTSTSTSSISQTHPSRSGTLSVHPPTSHNPSHSSPSSSSTSPLEIPFTLTSTCPQLHQDFSCLSTDLLTNLLLLYPDGPTSSPYYTFTPSSSSSSSPDSISQDTYSISETVIQPSTQPGTEFRSSLYISITPATSAGVSGIAKEEWTSFMGLLHSVHVGLGLEMKGMGWGMLEFGGEFPKLREKEKKEKDSGKMWGPSDVVFSSSDSDEEDGEGEGDEIKEIFSFMYKATWVYYGVMVDRDGKEVLRECTQMPLGVDIDIDFEGESWIEKEAVPVEEVMGNVLVKEGDDISAGAEGEERWKIDL